MVLKKHELLEVIKKELYTPVVGDILDQMGLYHQFLPQAVRPLRDDMKLAGYAMTVLMIDVFGQQKKPFGYLTEALDDLQEDEIYAPYRPPCQETGTWPLTNHWSEVMRKVRIDCHCKGGQHPAHPLP